MKTFLSIPIPEKVSPGDAVSAADHNALIDALKAAILRSESGRVASSADIGVRSATAAGQILYIKTHRGGGGSIPTPICPFGEIIGIPDSNPPAQGIRGGIIYCGDSLWNMDPQPLNLRAAGVWLVSLEIPVEVNRDDDESIVLPGIKTGTKPARPWTKTAWTAGTDYPDITPPVAATGAGKIVIPLGKLTITAPPAGSPAGTEGSAVFENSGCGNITVNQCSGTLSHTRG